MLMKLRCVMKDSWTINNFPFDKQKLRFSIENSQFDSHGSLEEIYALLNCRIVNISFF